VIAFSNDLQARARLFLELTGQGVPFTNVIDPSVKIHSNVAMGKGNVVIANCRFGACAIVGDNIGYLIGRKGGRWILERPGRFETQRRQVLITGEPFFERHGPKAVFFGRFFLGLRVWASWLAGATHMPWRSFLAWNALGGIVWAITIGLIAYFLGQSAGGVIKAFGLYGLAAVLLGLGSAWFLHRRQRRHAAERANVTAEERRMNAAKAQEHPEATDASAG
jgi:membrane protein DedA with SNARE-associated domain